MVIQRIESRLAETQDAFYKKCQNYAETIFEENHRQVNKKLKETYARMDAIEETN